jgi:hypothetical protein
MAFSSESSEETESSAAFSVCPSWEGGGISGTLPDEFSSRIPYGINTEITELRLLVEACERTLAECSN